MMPTIEETIGAFLHDLAVGQAEQTVQTYSQGLTRLKEFLGTIDHPLTSPASTLCVDHALQCAQWLSQERETPTGKIAKATLRTYLASISQFYSYMLRERIIDLSASDLERMRDAYRKYRRGYNRSLPKLPPDEAVQELLAAAHRVPSRPKKPRLELARLRNIAILEVLRSSGMRVGELVGLKRDDIDHRLHSARVTGKGEKERIVYFDDAAWRAIQAYLAARADGAKGRALYLLPVFARHDRRAGKKVLPMTTDGVRMVFNEIAKDARLDISMTPHSLRHAFATRVLESSGDLALVQDMLGHSSPATTRIYAKVSSKRMREAHREAFDYRGSEKDKE
jgi:site-specific recombinase XerD